MKILILGTSAKEHALAWKFSRSNRITGLFIAPGNSGTAEAGENCPDLDDTNHLQIADFCKKEKIDLVYIGGSKAICCGMTDKLNSFGITTFGANSKVAALEFDKQSAYRFMTRNNVSAVPRSFFSDYNDFSTYVEQNPVKLILKKNGYSDDRCVLDSGEKDKLLKFGQKILHKDMLVAEPFLQGFEVSLLTLYDGSDYILFPPSASYKKSRDNDEGFQTNGVGAICPAPFINSANLEYIKKKIIDPTFAGIKKEKLDYRGALLFSILVHENDCRLIDYHVRWADPDAQAILPLLQSDFTNLIEAVVNSNLKNSHLDVCNCSSVAVVLASSGYPGTCVTGKTVTMKRLPPPAGSMIFHGAVQKEANGNIVTSGGRCFTVVGTGVNLVEANLAAYATAGTISFEGAWYRKDIGNLFFSEEISER